MENKGTNLTPEQALDRLEELYEQSVNALREAIADYVDNGTLPDPHARLNGLFVYPSLSVSWDGATPNPPKTRAFGRFTHPGCYTTTVTRPALFRAYLLEQLNLVYHDYGAHIAVEASHHEIPYPYVIDGSALTLDRSMSAGLTRHFPTTELAQIGDETADGLFHPGEFYPLSHFDARRVDFSLAGYGTIPVRRLNIFSPSFCLPTTPAMSMSLCAGDAAKFLILTVPMSRFPVLAEFGSRQKRKRRKRLFPIWPGRSIRCPPGTW